MADLVLKDEILQGSDFRNRIFDSVKVRYNSVFESSLAYMQIQGGGDFTGNGWEQCNFFGCDISNMKLLMEQFRRCSFGNARFMEIYCDGMTVTEGSFVRSLLCGSKIEKCRFENCNFRGMQIRGTVLNRCTFIRCIFDETGMEDSVLYRAKFSDCIFFDLSVPFELDGSTMKFVNCKGKRN